MIFLASLLPLIIVSIGVGANPVPPSGRFAYPGGPDLATGVWKAVAENSDSAVVMAVADASGQLSFRQPSTGEVVSTVISYISYECISNDTFIATTEGISYPTLAPISQCSIYFINETHRAVNSLPLSGGKCPNAAFAGFKLGPNGAFSRSNIYEYVDGVLPRPESYVCQNRTRARIASSLPAYPPSVIRPFQLNNTTNITLPLPSAISAPLPPLPPAPPPPSPPPPSPPTPFPSLPKSGGAAVPLGIWKAANIIEIITRDGYYANVYNPSTDELIANRSTYVKHECVESDSYTSTTEQFGIYLNGTTTPLVPSCETGRRRNKDSGEILDVAVAVDGDECPSLDAIVGTDDGQPSSVPLEFYKFSLEEP